METRIRKTGDSRHIVANRYDGRKLAGPFDTFEEAAKAQASGDYEAASGPPVKKPKRDPKTVLGTETGATKGKSASAH